MNILHNRNKAQKSTSTTSSLMINLFAVAMIVGAPVRAADAITYGCRYPIAFAEGETELSDLNRQKIHQVISHASNASLEKISIHGFNSLRDLNQNLMTTQSKRIENIVKYISEISRRYRFENIQIRLEVSLGPTNQYNNIIMDNCVGSN